MAERDRRGKHPERGAGHPEVEHYNVIKQVELRRAGSFGIVTNDLFQQARTIEEIAESAPHDVFALRQFTSHEGVMKINGDRVRFTTDRTYGRTIFLDGGDPLTRDDVRSRRHMEEYRKLYTDMTRFGWKKVIAIRTGGHQPFLPGDTNLNVTKKGR